MLLIVNCVIVQFVGIQDFGKLCEMCIYVALSVMPEVSNVPVVHTKRLAITLIMLHNQNKLHSYKVYI